MNTRVRIGLATMALTSLVAAVRLEPATGSAMNLYVEKTGLLSGKKHHFTFDRFQGEITPDRRVTLQIESASLVCRDTWISEKDRPKIVKVALEDMLAAAKHPLIRFESSQVRETAPDTYFVEGLLTIRDVGRPVTVQVKRVGPSYSGEARFKLTSFGLKPPSAALGLVGTKDEMAFTFSLPVKEDAQR